MSEPLPPLLARSRRQRRVRAAAAGLTVVLACLGVWLSQGDTSQLVTQVSSDAHIALKDAAEVLSTYPSNAERFAGTPQRPETHEEFRRYTSWLFSQDAWPIAGDPTRLSTVTYIDGCLQTWSDGERPGAWHLSGGEVTPGLC